MQGIGEIIEALGAFALLAMSHKTTLLLISAVTSMLLQYVPRTKIYDAQGQVDETQTTNVQKFLLTTGLIDGGLAAGSGVAGLLNGDIVFTNAMLALIGVQLALNTAMKLPWPAVASIGTGVFVASNLPGYASWLTDMLSNNAVLLAQLGTGIVSMAVTYGVSRTIKDVMAGGSSIMNIRVIAIPIAVIAAVEGILLTMGMSVQPGIEYIVGLFA